MSDFVPQLAHTIDREKVLAARAMTPEERLLAGGRMFDAACEHLTAELKTAFPHAPADTVQAMLREIIRAAERCGVL